MIEEMLIKDKKGKITYRKKVRYDPKTRKRTILEEEDFRGK